MIWRKEDLKDLQFEESRDFGINSIGLSQNSGRPSEISYFPGFTIISGDVWTEAKPLKASLNCRALQRSLW